MDGGDGACRLLAGFLTGELDPAEARLWDEHLLECEACWRAVREDRAGRQAAQVLREPTPAGLADRVAFAVEVAAADRAPAPRHARPRARSSRWARSGGWRHWPRPAAAGTIAAAALVTLAVLLLPGAHQARSVPPAVAVVADYARAVPRPASGQHPHPGDRVPVEVGHPVSVTAGGQRIVLRTWRLGGTEAVVAVSDKPFPMPARAMGVAGKGMAWSAQLGTLGLYCLNGPTSELVAAPVPAAELAALAARLPLP